MTAHTRLDPPLVESIRRALTGNALPGETQGLSREGEREAAEFLSQVAVARKPGALALEIQSIGGEAGNRRMRIGIVNDDMPFLVELGRERGRRAAADHSPPASPGRVRHSRRTRRAAIGRAAVRRQGSPRVDDVPRARSRRRARQTGARRRLEARPRRCSARGTRLGVAAAADARGCGPDYRSRRRRLAQLVCRRRDDPARLSGRETVRSPVEHAGHLQHPRRPHRRRRRARCDALFRTGRRRTADGQGRAQVDRPSPGAARPARGADQAGRRGRRDRRACRPLDQRGAARSSGEGAGAAFPPEAARRGFRLRSEGSFGQGAAPCGRLAAARSGHRHRLRRAPAAGHDGDVACRSPAARAAAGALDPQGPAVHLRLAAARGA